MQTHFAELQGVQPKNNIFFYRRVVLNKTHEQIQLILNTRKHSQIKHARARVCVCMCVCVCLCMCVCVCVCVDVQ